MEMKARTMVYLEASQLQALKRDARARRISLAELFRQLVQQHLTEADPLPAPNSESFLRIVGMASSGRNDIAQNHDTYLGEAIRREHAR
jgi:hypothetical protein